MSINIGVEARSDELHSWCDERIAIGEGQAEFVRKSFINLLQKGKKYEYLVKNEVD